MVLRLAQSIGLHRDGANFGLSPFETEMRRRIWGHMIKQNDRSSEDHGIDVSAASADTDIQEALNINDSDIYPEIKQLPAPQMHWTEMTAAVCIRRLGITVAYVVRLVNEMKAGDRDAAHWALLSPDLPLTEARRAAIMAERNRYVDDLLAQCSMVVPVQRATYKMTRLVQLKFDFITRLQLATILGRGDGRDDKSKARSSVPAIATEEHLRLACEVIEVNSDIMDDEVIQDFRWTAEIYPQYHVLLYVLWHLCVQPGVYDGNPALAARAWAVADGMYVMEAARQKRQNVRARNSKWTMLMALRDKAVKVRTAYEKAAYEKAGGPAGGDGAAEGAGNAGNAGNAENAENAGDADMDSSNSSRDGVLTAGRPKASANQSLAAANQDANSNGGTSTTGLDSTGLAPGHILPSAVPTDLLAAGNAATAVDLGVVGSATYGQAELADADMAEYLGESTLGMGMDIDWVRGFMDWNAVADDFRMRAYDDGM